MQNTSSQMLDRYIRARYPLIYVVSHEENRVMAAIQDVAKKMKSAKGSTPRTVVEWTLTKGFTIVTENATITGMNKGDEYSDPNSALSFVTSFDIENNHAPVLFIFKDLHRIMNNDLQVTRYLRDVFNHFETRKHNLIMLSPEMTLPADIEKQVAVIDWALPGIPELEAVLRQAEAELPVELQNLNGSRDMVVQAMRGLTDGEAANALKAGIISAGNLDDSVIKFILSEKKQIIRKSNVLEYFEATVEMDQVGGNENLKEYAAMKREMMSEKAREAGVDAPKGVLLVGPPGTGKSLAVKAIAGSKYPLVRMDFSRMQEGTVGSGNRNMTKALRFLEAIAPCVVWLDEAEKAFADNGGASDGGEKMGMLGTFLTWMQENTLPIYCAFTANSVEALRPELLSRFDDVVFVDLPDAKSREEILRVHLTKRKVKNFKDLKDVVSATYGFSGREIEKVVKFAVERAFYENENKPLTVKHMLTAAERIVPTSETKKDEINRLREWAKGKAIPAGRSFTDDKPVQNSKTTLEL
jgi:AAA+ superfamily predicted ATPase